MTTELKLAEAETLLFILLYVRHTGCSPTAAEIGRYFHISEPAAWKRCAKLHAMGYLLSNGQRSRRYEVNEHKLHEWAWAKKEAESLETVMRRTLPI